VDVSAPVLRDLVLLGGGHAHIEVLRRFAMRPLAGARLTLISPDTLTAYSGMLPGLISGHYRHNEIHIDLVRLCRRAGARFIQDRVVGLDLEVRRVVLAGRPAIVYDTLSINTGATPNLSGVPGAGAHAVPVKPVGRFLDHWAKIEAMQRPPKIAVVGGGAGGIEIALAIDHRLGADNKSQIHLIEAGPVLLPGHSPGARRRLENAMDEAGITRYVDRPVDRVDEQSLVFSDGEKVGFDLIVWTTGVAAPDWLADTGLELDADGFIAVDFHLRSRSHREVFAAGDIAAMTANPRPKSGVFAVRQGGPLADNLRRQLSGKPLLRFQPQRRFLGLMATGDRRAVASWDGLSAEGNWVWRWKDRIDRRFMARYEDLPDMTQEIPRPSEAVPGTADAMAANAMRCRGCGAKLPGGALARALSRLAAETPETVGSALDLSAPDDAAIMAPPPGRLLVQSLDYFPAFISDPYVFGQIAANHCLGDLYAMGADPWTVLALAVVPPGPEEKMEEELFQMLSGALVTLAEAGANLVGGHSGEGPELALGFAVNGLITPGAEKRKSGMVQGDRLILSKPLGTGALFAAEMRGLARGLWVETAINTMLRSSRSAAECLTAHGAHAMTDVTGFGFAGHLKEMLVASGCSVSIDVQAIPILPGATDVIADGIESSLGPANRQAYMDLLDEPDAWSEEELALLADPQTAGGVLAAVPADQADACVARLQSQGDEDARIVGTVEPMRRAFPSLYRA
jgi:selenide, water dikinase